MFWRTPELVDSLLPFLDGDSTLILAKVLPLALNIILGKTSWRKLVRRICPHDSDFEEALVSNKKRMLVLADILKMAEEPKPLLLDLLHVICERFPPLKRAHLLRLEVPGPEFIEVSCGCGLVSHSVQPCGFSLLEAVEEALGTGEQLVKRASLDLLEEPLLVDLVTHLLRHQDLVDPWGTPAGVAAELVVMGLSCDNNESAKSISTLLQHCQSLRILDALYTEAGFNAWKELGKALSGIEVKLTMIDSCRKNLVSAAREDLRAIWEDAGGKWGWDEDGTFEWRVWLEDQEVFETFEQWHLLENCLDGIGLESQSDSAEEDAGDDQSLDLDEEI